MRTAQRDQGATTTFGAYVTDAASGAGVAYPGIPFTFTRTGTGGYQINFDPRLRAVSVTATADAPTRTMQVGGWGPGGTFTVARTIANTGVGENGGFTFLCTALDKRL